MFTNILALTYVVTLSEAIELSVIIAFAAIFLLIMAVQGLKSLAVIIANWIKRIANRIKRALYSKKEKNEG